MEAVFLLIFASALCETEMLVIFHLKFSSAVYIFCCYAEAFGHAFI